MGVVLHDTKDGTTWEIARCSVERAENPSPLAGEDAARRAAGEGLGGAVILGGTGSRGPSPVRSLRSRTSSPVKGEGKGWRSSDMR